MKKVLVDFQDTIGGAPRSQLEHAKALASRGYEIIAVIDDKVNNDFFKNTNFTVHNLPTFGGKGFSERVQILRKYKNLVEMVKPDLLYTNRTSHVYFLSILSDVTGIPILCARAGGSNIQNLHKANRDRNYVLYSEENYNDFIDLGFPIEQLFVIKNRIPELEIKQKKSVSIELINILIVGNLKQETIQGLKWVLKKFADSDDDINQQYKVKIAGTFVGLSKNQKADLVSLIKESNQKLQNGEIIHLGWVDNLITEIENADICLGKGRSVVQPLMAGKTCYVLSEENGIFHCDESNFKQLTKTNFTGRKMDNDGGFTHLIDTLNGDNTLATTDKVVELAKREYSVEYLGNKLEPVVKKLSDAEFDKSFSKAIKRYTYILILGVFVKLKKYKK